MFRSFHEIEQHLIQNQIKKRIVLCGSQDEIALDAVVRAKHKGFVAPILIGDQEKTSELLEALGENAADYQLIHEPRELRAARKAIQMIQDGEADIPMKGLMQSASYLMAIKNPRGGLLDEGAMLNEATAFYFKDQDRIIITGDCAINIAPNLEEKATILKNLVDLAKILGCAQVKVAAVSVLEKPDPTIPSTMDAAALAEMDWNSDVVVEGPFALDNALDAEAAKHKGISSPVAGHADVLLMPDIHAGNIIHKAIHFFGHYPYASIACGTRSPIIFNSRTDDAESKYNSIMVAILQSLSQ